MLEVRDLTSGYGGKPLVHDVTFDLAPCEFCCIIGANGCGKTTTLKTILGLLDPIAGSIHVGGEDVLAMGERERAGHFAYIPQTHKLPFPFQVKDVVLMGRTPYVSQMASLTRHDRRVAYAALCQLEIQNLANEPYSELSGGQQQLVLIARALAQQPDILVMDEPTASLDFGNQQLVLSRMRNLVDSGMSVLMVTHDPAHAFYCADSVIVLHGGRVLAKGASHEVITKEAMRTIYGTDVLIDRVDVGEGRCAYACVAVTRHREVDERYLHELRSKPSRVR